MNNSNLKIFLLIIFIFVLSSQIFSQIKFNRIYGGSGGEQVYSIKQTFDGGYIFTGLISIPNISGNNVWLVKLDAFGDTSWTKSYGFDWVEEAYEVIQMPDSGYVLLGKSTSASSGLYNDFWLLRTNQFGDTLWTKFYGDLWEQETPTNIIRTSDGGFAMIGVDLDFVQNGSVWLLKTNALGDTLWTKKYGGPYGESAACILETSDNGFLIGGSINLSYISPNYQMYLIKTDSLGDTLWTKMYGSSFGENANALLEIPGNGYYIAGTIGHYTQGLNNDIWFLKISDTGDSLWSKYYGSSGNEYATSMHPTADGNYIIGGAISVGDMNTDGLYLIKINSNGDTLWTRRYGGDSNDWGTDAIITNDGGFALSGYTNSFGALLRDGWIIKTDISGLVTQTSIPEQQILNTFQLYQNYPNPFNPSTTIKFSLPKSEFVELKVYNILGKEVTTLVSNKLNQGKHTYTFNGKNLASGIYYSQLVAGEYREVKKMILLR